MKHYHYEAQGTAANGQTWRVNGTIDGTFTEIIRERIMSDIMRDVFNQLTQGKAIFGRPGVGCNGPYQITKFLIEERTP